MCGRGDFSVVGENFCVVSPDMQIVLMTILGVLQQLKAEESWDQQTLPAETGLTSSPPMVDAPTIRAL